jgi:alkylation response protein AidB-like acyl-CoA dehydrogenase
MNFKLTEDQLILQRMVHDFTAHNIEPLAEHIERTGKLPDNLIKELARSGLLGMVIPKKYGGSEATNLSCVLAIEQIAYSGTGVWWLVAFNNSIPYCIVHFGSEELKQKYLRPFCTGAAYASLQFTEEDTGSDPNSLSTKAIPDGNNYVINGMKRFSTFGARKGYAIVYAKDDTEACTAFIIPKLSKGYIVEKTWKLMGEGGLEANDISFQDMCVPATNILGQKTKGLDILLDWIALEKIQQCGASIGIAQAALDESLDYANARKSRGKSISSMQGIKWMFAEMECRLTAARWLTYRAAFLHDQNAADWRQEASSAKLFVTRAILEIVEIARQIHGCYGYTCDFKIERLYRAAAGASGIATSLEINRSIVGNWVTTRSK